MISRTKFTKNVLVGSPAVLIRDEIHCNEYPGTRRVMSVGYPDRKFSTRFNPTIYNIIVCNYSIGLIVNKHIVLSKCLIYISTVHDISVQQCDIHTAM